MSNTIKIGIADMNVAASPDILVTFALGSCIAICLYEPNKKIAGMVHIMLPDSKQIAGSTAQPLKFADSGLLELLKAMQMKGASPAALKAKIAGGAQMFAVSGNNPLGNIGARNVEAVKAGLARFRIPIIAEDTGKDYGRTCFFDAATGVMTIKSALKGEWTF